MKKIIILVFALFLNFLALAQESREMLNVNVKTQKDAERVEKLNLESIEKFRKLAETDPDAYLPELSVYLNNLASIYSKQERFQESEAKYLEALEVDKTLAKKYPKTYEFDVVIDMTNIALLYQKTNRLKEAENYYEQSLNRLRKISQQYPNKFEAHLSVLLNNMAILYQNQEKYEQAEKYYLETFRFFVLVHLLSKEKLSSFLILLSNFTN